MTILIVLLVIAAVWIIALYSQLNQVKLKLSKLPAAAKDVDIYIGSLEREVYALKRTLVNVFKGRNQTLEKIFSMTKNKDILKYKVELGKSAAALAAQVYLYNIDNISHSTDLLKRIYTEHGLPEQFSSQIAMVEFNDLNGKKWDQEVWDANYEKYENMLKRKLATDFEDIQDEIDDDQKFQRELDEKTSEYM